VRYLDGARARVGRVEESRVIPYDLEELSVLAADISPRGTMAAVVGSPAAQPGLITVDLGDARSPSRRAPRKTPIGDGISSALEADRSFDRWAWGSLETVVWRNGEGTPIEGVLYTPENFAGGMARPLLVVAHGGPGTAAPAVRRDWEDCYVYPVYQLLARGVLVLKPNYRCSDGYGRAFHDAHVGSGGALHMMLADIEAGVDFMIKKGWVDPTRVGLAGWSAGGGIAAYASVHSSAFSAVSCGAGAVDHLIYFASSTHPEFAVPTFGGYPWEGLGPWLNDSAAWQEVRRVTPTLIQHGEEDPVCTMTNAKALYLTLKHQGVPVTFVRFPGHGHGVFAESPKAALTVMSQNLKWFSHHLLGFELDWDNADELEE
jgi:dipeptidyl aminopeptidase/acylaminoacyl peptidase